MDLSEKSLWQVGAGDTDRSYGDVCLRHDVMIAGPGDRGPFNEEQYANLGDIKHSLRRFYREAKRGDVVLLRIGTGRILAVGEIGDETAQHLDAFGDVDGWDLHHCRRVRWFPETSKEFPPTTLGGQVRTFASVNVSVVRRWVEKLEIAPSLRQRPLSPLPPSGNKLDENELSRKLFVEGLPSDHVDRLTHRFSSLRRIASWYSNKDKRPQDRPSEHETITYLIVPLLFSLGWSEQTAAIEWNKVDIALFERMPSNDSTLNCVIEAKLLGRSVFSAVGQAEAYASKPERKNCKRLIVTDGIRYALHRRIDDHFKLTAYLNLLRLRDEYPALGCKGAVEAILGMSRDAVT